MASWNDPSNSSPVHVNLLQDLANKDTYAATMGQTNLGAYTDLPDGTMNWDNGQKLLRRVQSGTPEVVKISLAGGGTGASDAAGARSAFNVLEAGTGAAQSRTNTQNDSRFVQGSRSISTTSPLQGGGDLSANRTLSIQDASTTQKGAVQLENTLNSTSTSLALTAAQGKILGDMFRSESKPLDNQFTGGTAYFAKAGNIVTVELFGGSNISSDNVSSTFGFVPLWARPNRQSHGSVVYEIESYGVHVTINITGSIQISYFDSSFSGVNREFFSGSIFISYTI